MSMADPCCRTRASRQTLTVSAIPVLSGSRRNANNRFSTEHHHVNPHLRKVFVPHLQRFDKFLDSLESTSLWVQFSSTLTERKEDPDFLPTYIVLITLHLLRRCALIVVQLYSRKTRGGCILI